jgi:hypothetical protein
MDRLISDSSGGAAGWTLVEVGALARAETYDLAPEVDDVMAALHAAAPPTSELSEIGRSMDGQISDNSQGEGGGEGDGAGSVFAQPVGRVDDGPAESPDVALPAEEPRP